ncbi:MAG: LemA family protein [Nitrospirae bacterium]|nr:LemA family protein [Nitrospirota bacterium]MCL5978444.1 LemA family protein [Nitrospirota bacterium]
MKEIIKKLYARELDLIAEKPVAVKPGGKYIILIKQRVWDRQSAAVKIAITASLMVLISALVYYYNLFTVEHFKVRLENAQIEAELQRRNDLIPGLTRAVSDYMSFEGRIFEHAADVRSALGSIKNIAGESPAPMSIHPSLSKFQAVAENYPDLKASATYQSLMNELSNTETRIAEARIRYNRAANYYNSRLKMVPGAVFGCLMGFSPVKTFEAERAVEAGTAAK